MSAWTHLLCLVFSVADRLLLALSQLKFTRKEWDLNRPDLKQIDSAARVGDDDPRIGAASMQKFEGEDLSVRPATSTSTLRYSLILSSPPML